MLFTFGELSNSLKLRSRSLYFCKFTYPIEILLESILLCVCLAELKDGRIFSSCYWFSNLLLLLSVGLMILDASSLNSLLGALPLTWKAESASELSTSTTFSSSSYSFSLNLGDISTSFLLSWANYLSMGSTKSSSSSSSASISASGTPSISYFPPSEQFSNEI
jgi:hypothetical protein